MTARSEMVAIRWSRPAPRGHASTSSPKARSSFEAALYRGNVDFTSVPTAATACESAGRSNTESSAVSLINVVVLRICLLSGRILDRPPEKES